MSERGGPGHVGRAERVSAGGEVVESGLGVNRLLQHDYVDHDAEAVELVFLPDLVVPPDLAALTVEGIPGEAASVEAVPANRLAALARYGLAAKAPALRDLAEPRKTATLLATARHLEATAVDDAWTCSTS